MTTSLLYETEYGIWTRVTYLEGKYHNQTRPILHEINYHLYNTDDFFAELSDSSITKVYYAEFL